MTERVVEIVAEALSNCYADHEESYGDPPGWDTLARAALVPLRNRITEEKLVEDCRQLAIGVFRRFVINAWPDDPAYSEAIKLFGDALGEAYRGLASSDGNGS